jgi:glycosyltransferase involved in cell wall biosynthesis
MFYNQADIFIFPAQDEACSNALIEAQASGLPILALNSGGNPELVLSSGEMFSDTQTMYEGLHKIINNYEKYSREALELTNNRNSIQAYENFINSLDFANDIRFTKVKIIWAIALTLKLKLQIKLSSIQYI